MKIYEIILVIVFVTLSNVAVFLIAKGNEKIQTKAPIKKIRLFKTKEEKYQEEKLEKQNKIDEINLHNIESYSGDSLGQKDFDL